MNRIAALFTCYNRKEKTLRALEHLYKAKESQPDFDLDIYLTDDGSTDGTGTAVKERFPQVEILLGNGNLFWAGGMLNSWSEALLKKYDAYLLLNDDTNVFPDLFEQIFKTHDECIKIYEESGIYIGSTKDAETGLLSYGGAYFKNRYKFLYEFIEPKEHIQSCELGNANIMLVTQPVVDKIGILSKGYRHGVADYDYTLKALNKKIPILVMPGYCGTCSDDHQDIYQSFPDKTLKERFRLLKDPLALDFRSNLLLMRRHFPTRVPFVVLAALLKLFFPNLYIKARGKGSKT